MNRNRKNTHSEKWTMKLQHLYQNLLEIRKDGLINKNKSRKEIFSSYLKSIIEFNEELNKPKYHTERELGVLVKPFYMLPYSSCLPQELLYLIDVDFKGQHFRSTEIHCWKKIFRFHEHLSTLHLICLDTYSRINIRKQNRSSLSEYQIGEHNISELLNPRNEQITREKLEVLLYLCELGLIEGKECPKIVHILNAVRIQVDFVELADQDSDESDSQENHTIIDPVIGELFKKVTLDVNKLFSEQVNGEVIDLIHGITKINNSMIISKKKSSSTDVLGIADNYDGVGLTEDDIIETNVVELCELQINLLIQTITLYNDDAVANGTQPFYKNHKFYFSCIEVLMKNLELVSKFYNFAEMPNCSLRDVIDQGILILFSVMEDPFVLSYQRGISDSELTIEKKFSESEEITKFVYTLSRLLDLVYRDSSILNEDGESRRNFIESLRVFLEDFGSNAADKQDAPDFKRACNGTNINTTFINLIEYLYVLGNKDLCKISLSILRILLHKNSEFQSIFFNRRCESFQDSILEEYPLELLGIIQESFELDSEYVFKSKTIWIRIFRRLVKVLDHCWLEIEKNEDNSIISWVSISLITKIFEKLMKNNDDNAQERAYDVEIQEVYSEIIMRRMRPLLIEFKMKDLHTQYQPVILNLSFDETIGKVEALRNTTLTQAQVYSLKMDVFYDILFLINESTQKWVYLDSSLVFGSIFELIYCGDSPDDPMANDILFNQTPFGLLFITEFIKLFTNLELFEFDRKKTKKEQILHLEKELKSASHLIMLFISVCSQIREFGNSQEQEEINRSFIINGIIRMVYKYAKGLMYELSPKSYHAIDFYLLLDSFGDHFKKISSLLKLDISTSDKGIKRVGKILELASSKEYKRTKLTHQEKGNYEERKKSYLDKVYPVKELCEIIEEILKQLECNFIIQDFDREDHIELQKSPIIAFTDMQYYGSFGLEKLFDKIMKVRAETGDLSSEQKKSLMNDERFLQKFDKVHQEYIKGKYMFFKEDSNILYNFLDEGTEDSDEIYYKVILEWILSHFCYNRLGAKQHEKLKGSSNQLMVLRNPEMLSWVNLLNNLLEKKPKCRDILFSEFFEDDLEMLKIYEKISNNESLVYEYEDQINQSKYNRLEGRTFIKILFEAIFFFQEVIKRETFAKSFLLNHESYFMLCLTIKNLAEDNFIPFKEYVGFLQYEHTSIDDNTKKLNFVEKRKLLNELYNGIYFSPKSKPLSKHVFERLDRPDLNWFNIITIETLTEYFTGPCSINQDSFTVDLNKAIAFLGQVNLNMHSSFYIFQLKLTILLLSLCEGVSRAFCTSFTDKYPPSLLYVSLSSHLSMLFSLNANEGLKLTSSSLLDLYTSYPSFAQHPSISIATSFYFLLKSLCEKSKKYKIFLHRKLDDLITKSSSQIGGEAEEALLFVTTISGSIEVQTEDRVNIQVYFPLPPECKYLSNHTKAQFLLHCNNEDTAGKTLDLMKSVPLFKIEVESGLDLFRKWKTLNYFAEEDFFIILVYIAWVISLLLNLLVIKGYEYNYADVWNLEYMETIIVNILEGILFFTCLLFLIVWFVFKYKMKTRLARERIRADVDNQGMAKWRKWLRIYIYQSIILEEAPISLILHIIFVLLKFINPIAYTFHLFMLIFFNQTCQYVIKSITEHISMLITTFLLVIFIVYSYSFVNALNYRNIFDENDTQGYDFCESLHSCMFYILDFGLRNGGGIADSEELLPITDKKFYPKLMFNISFFMIINTIALNIVFGIILDTFAELRDNQEKRSISSICNSRLGDKDYLPCLWVYKERF